MNHEEVLERLWRFAARIGKVVDSLPDTAKGKGRKNGKCGGGTDCN